MSIRTRVTPNRAPDSQRADAPLVLAFGRGWRGEEGLRDASGPGGGSALAPLVRVWEAAARPYCYPRGGGGERAAAGARPGATAGGSVPPCGPAGSPWRLALAVRLGSLYFFYLSIYLFISGWVGEAQSPPLWPRSGNSVLPRVPWTSGASVAAPREEQYIAFESGGGPRSTGETPRWWGVGDFCKP